MTGADDRIYPCKDCGTMRSKNEGGAIFTVCDECWDKHHAKYKTPSVPKIGSVCCKEPIEGNQRFCPRCGWECYIEPTVLDMVVVRRKDLEIVLEVYKDWPNDFWITWDRLRAAMEEKP